MTTQKPHVIFIVLDTHRADRLGCYGYPRGTSPNLDAFAKSATLYENAIAPAQWTIPSHASMFSGEYPTTHQTVQANGALGNAFPTIAEYLRTHGYQSSGFCNNPLVGVLNNGLRRGFDAFYNYGGAIPSKPDHNGHTSLKILAGIRHGYRNALDRIANPIQQAVAASADVFQVILNPWLVSLWTRYANFKGDGPTSIKDTAQFIKQNFSEAQKPQFTFLNLMGTHLPFTPPDRFIRGFAPFVKDEPAARDFMNVYNTQALRWLLPLEESYSQLESLTLSQMYDAEVAYQDHLLHRLFSLLERPDHRENTLVIITADHGEMLGEHQYMGHGLGLYQELIRVPLLIRFPGQMVGERVSEVVSTTRLFHTVLDAAGIDSAPSTGITPRLSLGNKNGSNGRPRARAFSEAYPPDNVINIMRKQAPDLIDTFHTQSIQRAAFSQTHKLIRIEGQHNLLFDLRADAQEMHPAPADTEQATHLNELLDNFVNAAVARQSTHAVDEVPSPEDEAVLERLRALGYIE